MAARGLVLGAVDLFQVGQRSAVALVGVIGGVGLPQFVLARLRKRRIKKFIDNFPKALDIIVRGVKAGLPLGDTMRIVANESPEPVRRSSARSSSRRRSALRLPEAVERMAQRVPVTETNFFSIVIEIQSKAGGNLSEAMGNLSRVCASARR